MNVSLPVGAAIWPLQVVVQFTTTGDEGPGDTVIDADFVDADT
ncbi:MAG TPA: hypothetical protein VHT05_00465 [Candidatus Elarobacter sp.]|nr:hypothetical protein [Candidatus Elarobacter sp.]